ncbi:efflux RND transporter periplasmic adaptor subunit [Xylanibacter ruminicola]|uniref:RND family efflux transporter, MFP subunit n=1 Tax=Xylanibacter ruminicola TaxID=839 RepID=A0A1M6VC28_XYLRU|nr:efflux RND transporter periplasmic adaptor subunit [Xylanibacter ruminicola]SHK78931.1 RND family efflux transporter, MFP subunit [Xylanibacter ruminicola]
MNKYLSLCILLLASAACSNHSKEADRSAEAAGTNPGDSVANIKSAGTKSLQQAINRDGFSSKGTIQAVTEVPVYSRINEQIVAFNVEMGQRIKKGQVVVRLSQAALHDQIVRCKAELEHAEYQYQAILMGQGYKRHELEQASDDIKRQARINSGYNTAKASLQQLEHQLSYCTIAAPISGAVSRIEAALYGAATPGTPLFYMVDTEHLKVCFDVLESEFQNFQIGTKIQVVSIAYPSESHSAVVTAISPVIEKNGMVHLEAQLSPHPHLMPGMTAIVTLAKPS